MGEVECNLKTAGDDEVFRVVWELGSVREDFTVGVRELELDHMQVVFADGSREDLPGMWECKLGGMDRDFVI